MKDTSFAPRLPSTPNHKALSNGGRLIGLLCQLLAPPREGSLPLLVKQPPATSDTNGGTITMKSRAAIFEGVGKPLILDEIEVDPPKQGEVLVRLQATGLCHTEIWYMGGGDQVD